MEHKLRRSTIAAVVRGEVAKQGAKRVELAKSVGVSPGTLRTRLNGEQSFNVDEFATTCHLLGVPVAEMLDRAGVK